MAVENSSVDKISHQRRRARRMEGSHSRWRPPRSCEVYWSEFRHCKSLINRFHEYYTYGRKPDCQQWKEDYSSCKEWEKSHSTQAKESLQESERKRLADQRKFTPVWELRQSPPADWHQPLNQGKPQDS